MKVLVAGGAGFVGSHFCRRLLADGHDVVCVDNLVTGQAVNIADLTAIRVSQFVRTGVEKTPAVDGRSRRASRLAGEPGRLRTAAARNDGGQLDRDVAPARCRARGEGALRLRLDLGGVRRSACSSSAGDLLGQCRSDRPALVLRRVEALWRSPRDLLSTRPTGVRAAIIRVFNTYGPAMRLEDGRVMPEFFGAAYSGEPLRVQGDGSQTRSFMYVDDLVEALTLLSRDEDLDGQLLNVGNPAGDHHSGAGRDGSSPRWRPARASSTCRHARAIRSVDAPTSRACEPATDGSPASTSTWACSGRPPGIASRSQRRDRPHVAAPIGGRPAHLGADEPSWPRPPTADAPRRCARRVGVSAIDLPAAVDRIAEWIGRDAQNYVCVTGVHGVMESQRDEDLRRIHNASGMTTPDGMPMVWAGHWAGASWMRRVYGPDLMLAVCERARRDGLAVLLLRRSARRPGACWRERLGAAFPGPPRRGHVLAAIPAS